MSSRNLPRPDNKDNQLEKIQAGSKRKRSDENEDEDEDEDDMDPRSEYQWPPTAENEPEAGRMVKPPSKSSNIARLQMYQAWTAILGTGSLRSACEFLPALGFPKLDETSLALKMLNYTKKAEKWSSQARTSVQTCELAGVPRESIVEVLKLAHEELALTELNKYVKQVYGEQDGGVESEGSKRSRQTNQSQELAKDLVIRESKKAGNRAASHEPSKDQHGAHIRHRSYRSFPSYRSYRSYLNYRNHRSRILDK